MAVDAHTRPFVLLLREPAHPDPYEAALAERGFRVRSVPVLSFSFVNQADLRAAFVQPERYGGLILTSPRAVEALSQVFGEEAFLLASWKKKPVYVVGPSTAERAAELGFKPTGEEAGRAEVLGEVILSRRFERPLLFLCGNRSRDVLPERLKAAGTALESLCVYETHLRAGLDFRGEAPNWVVFFSPSGVEAVRSAKGVDWGRARKAAIGPVTEQALHEAGWEVGTVAAEPTPEALAEAIARQA